MHLNLNSFNIQAHFFKFQNRLLLHRLSYVHPGFCWPTQDLNYKTEVDLGLNPKLELKNKARAISETQTRPESKKQ